MQYTYSPTQNNGQITKRNDLSSGEEVTYTYDSLQRLIGAVTTDSPTVTQWGQGFTYDGFGNRTSASVTKGSAPYGNWSYDAATNRMGGYYDANGNMTFAASGYPAYTYGCGESARQCTNTHSRRSVPDRAVCIHAG
jgi:YD repeat-containing protein